MRSVEHHRVVPAPGPALAAQARYFRVLGDPTRLRMLDALLEGERTVAELVSITGAPRSRISNHLACLKWCRFVTARRAGRHVVYRAADPHIGELLALSKGLSMERCGYLARCRRIGPEWI
jgi:ArsR family transcriptional regulator, cadmium/lead-responsive transcriptional repressor